MKARIVDYSGGRHTVNHKQVILSVPGSSSKKDADKLVGKSVVWTSPAGKKISGHVSHSHGSLGKVKAVMQKGMPGQAVGQDAEVA
jgi:large subunit ribosomal protein L35Ae